MTINTEEYLAEAGIRSWMGLKCISFSTHHSIWGLFCTLGWIHLLCQLIRKRFSSQMAIRSQTHWVHEFWGNMLQHIQGNILCIQVSWVPGTYCECYVPWSRRGVWHILMPGFSREQCIRELCWLVAAAPAPLGKQGKGSYRQQKQYLSCLSEYQTCTFWLIWALAAWFGLGLLFSCLSPFEKHFPYDSKNILIILNVPKRHLDCYLAALEVTEGKLGGEKDLLIKYTLLNFL